jgi:hypothetical protein
LAGKGEENQGKMDKNGGNPWEIPSFNEESDECTMGTS